MVQEKVVLFQTKNGIVVNNDNYADEAKRVMEAWQSEERNPGSRCKHSELTTTKLRSIYGEIMNVYTKLNEESDFECYRSDLQYLKVKMAYEAGREQVVKDFLKNSHLLEALDGVKRYEQFLLYCRYAESLVAYFKFYGGKDK